VTAPTAPGAEPGPIAAATASLVEWLAGTADVSVQTGPPAEDESDGDGDGDGQSHGLSVWPLALLPERELRSAGQQREPLRFRVRHLVTGGTAALDRVLVAAMRAGEPAVSLESPSDHAWLALRARPRPALLIDVPTTVARPVPAVARVRSPLQVRGGPPRAVGGRVLAPGELPLAGIRVEVVSTGAWTYTDSAGRFAFAAVPDEEPVRLAVQGKGIRLIAQAQAGEDTVIDFNFEEA
jgi:hypothetical protein